MGANVTPVPCPTAEADLGGGSMEPTYLFDGRGRLAIGSDSNVGRYALAELREMEWSQRLAQRTLTMRADIVTYGRDARDWEQHSPEKYLSTLVCGAKTPEIQHVMIGGRWVIRDGVHELERDIDERYCAVLDRLRPAPTHASSGSEFV